VILGKLNSCLKKHGRNTLLSIILHHRQIIEAKCPYQSRRGKEWIELAKANGSVLGNRNEVQGIAIAETL
jgi:hypothetical protein